jgi:hypothetical protein
MSVINQIKAEIERRWKDYRNSVTPDQPKYRTHYFVGKGEVCEELLSFLDTLEPEEPTLTWGDVQLLDTFILECAREEREGKDWGESEEFYTEVLRRYNDFVKRTIPEIVSKIHEYNENDRKDSPEN